MKTRQITRWSFFGVILVMCIGISGFFLQQYVQAPQVSKQLSTQETQQKPIVSVTLDKNGDIATYSGVMAQTPYEALVEVSKKEGIPLVTKQYDFGIFVQKIGDLETGPDMAWIVSVNGKSLTVAADKETVKTGDMVQWAYTKAIY